jgi:hypothetical protein
MSENIVKRLSIGWRKEVKKLTTVNVVGEIAIFAH